MLGGVNSTPHHVCGVFVFNYDPLSNFPGCDVNLGFFTLLISDHYNSSKHMSEIPKELVIRVLGIYSEIKLDQIRCYE